MKNGYARIDAPDEKLDLQIEMLEEAGCEKIFSDIDAASSEPGQGLADALEYCKKGDALVVWRLDRLGSSLKNIIDTINVLHSRGIGFVSLQEKIDTTARGGKVVFQVFGALAEVRRNLLSERTKAGLRAARSRGQQSGRPKKLNEKKIELAQKLMQDPAYDPAKICKRLNISRSTFYRYLSETKR
jgi:DNA invertase Pin-like site-specific DNA recombinase